jgi:N-acetylmuramoyl-L-alanine amidase
VSSKYTWLLDNGHGGIVAGEPRTDGRRSPIWEDGSQLFEGEFNRAIVARIVESLTAHKIDYLLIAPELEDISLALRVQRANHFHRPCVFVSVHSNLGGGRGYEVFTSVGQTKSDEYAEIFLNEFSKVYPLVRIRRDILDGDSDKEANFTVLSKTRMPALLTENFFMDNENECRDMLMTKSGRDGIARAHVNAILRIEGRI